MTTDAPAALPATAAEALDKAARICDSCNADGHGAAAAVAARFIRALAARVREQNAAEQAEPNSGGARSSQPAPLQSTMPEEWDNLATFALEVANRLENESSSQLAYSIDHELPDELRKRVTRAYAAALPQPETQQNDPWPDTEADGVVFCGKCGGRK